MNLQEYKSSIIQRYNKSPLLQYFDYNNYENLKMETFSFSYRNKKLNGGYFFYDYYKQNELIIFVNGIASGYVSYMSEIEKLAKEHYKVLSIDNLGEFSSEGENIRSLSEALSILDSLLNHLKTNDWYSKTKIKLIGHSLGGYAVSNILNYHQDLDAIVSISGFISVNTILMQLNALDAFDYEKEMNPKYATSSAINAMKNANIPVLFIHSIDDNKVSYKDNFEVLKKSINNPNVHFLSVNNKFHNPDYTEDGVKYLNESFTTLMKLPNEKAIEFSKTIDFKRIIKLDENIFSKILNIIN